MCSGRPYIKIENWPADPRIYSDHYVEAKQGQCKEDC